MGLNNGQQAAVRALLAQEGSVDAVLDAIRALNVSDKKAAASSTLQGVVSVTVPNWTPFLAFLAAPANNQTPAIMDDIDAAIAAKDATKLGPLVAQLIAAVRSNLGR